MLHWRSYVVYRVVYVWVCVCVCVCVGGGGGGVKVGGWQGSWSRLNLQAWKAVWVFG